MSAADVSRRWLGGRGRSLGAGVLILASLAVGRVITDRLPDAGSVIEKPIERRGVIGAPIALRIGDVTVTEVTGATSWASVSEGKRTQGVWLAASIDLLPSRRESGLSYAAVRDSSGHVWELGRGESTCKAPIAGVPMHCQVLIELPRRPISNAELVLRWTNFDDRFDDQAVLPLTLDQATIDTWAGTEGPIKVPLATLGDS